MNILLLRDKKSAASGMGGELEAMLSRAGYAVAAVTLDYEQIRPCTGCFSCWLKTPGKCAVTSDGVNDIARKAMQAHAVVLLSEITFGGFSADIKAFLDRSVQNVLPFFETYEGEVHHPMRYERFPVWVAVGCGGSAVQRETFTRLARRNALNMRPERYLALTVGSAEELFLKEQAILGVLEAST